MNEEITITFKAWDCGCLPGVLEYRIRDVEQHMRVCGEKYTQEAKGHAETFLAQMKGCLVAIVTARAALVKDAANG